MTESSTSRKGTPRILLIDIDEDDEERIRELLDGAVKDEVVQSV